MNVYDFLALSPYEFEQLSRDLIQRQFSVFVESFKTGRDGGIDLRFATVKGEKVIVQAKCYRDYSSLYAQLKKEVETVRGLSPERYMLVTSAGLTPANKDKIKELFRPFVLETSDILGRDDLNNLLSRFEDVELKYYKLWLTGTSILKKVLHSRIYNQSSFEIEEIQSQVRLYVQNESFEQALSILKDNRYVIISGLPGIGKTTLARMLVLYLLSRDFDEFVYLGHSIDDGYEFFKEGKSQVFFFDDFLGRNFFEARHMPNEDNKLVKFIEKVKRTPDKLLILATREYILQQASLVFESFRIKNIEVAKCVLDLSSYTKLIKSKILYNHLYFARVPKSHLQDLLSFVPDKWFGHKKYEELISHPNYSPRIIQTVMDGKIWERCPADGFVAAFKGFLDNPESVWRYAFESSLDRFSQYALLVLLTMGTPVPVEDWEMALGEFLEVNAARLMVPFDSIQFQKAIKSLENTFIRTSKDSYTTFIVEYQNPSIQDFLVNYLRDKKDMIASLLSAAIFVDQFMSVFIGRLLSDGQSKKQILLEDGMLASVRKRLSAIFSNLRTCSVVKHTSNSGTLFRWHVDDSFKYGFMLMLVREYGERDGHLMDIVRQQFQHHIYLDDSANYEHYSYLQLLEKFNGPDLEFDPCKLIRASLQKMTWLSEMENFADFRKFFPEVYDEITSGQDFRKTFDEVVEREMSILDEADLDVLKSELEQAERLFDISLAYELDEVEAKKEQSSYDIDVDDDWSDRRVDSSDSGESESSQIDHLFNSLTSD